MPSNTAKKISIKPTAGDIQQKDIGAEAQYIDVSYDANGQVITDITQQGVTVASTKGLATLLRGNFGSYYGTCSTEASTATKVVTIPADQNFELKVGYIIGVKFTNSNSANEPLLNVNNTGAKNIFKGESIVSGSGDFITAGRICYFMYRIVTIEGQDEGQWCFISWGEDKNTTYTPEALGFGYGTCTTLASDNTKVAIFGSGTYSSIPNGIVAIRFSNDVGAGSTLTIVNTPSPGAPIYSRGAAITADVIKGGDTATFVYSGGYYHLISIDRSGGGESGLIPVNPEDTSNINIWIETE